MGRSVLNYAGVLDESRVLGDPGARHRDRIVQTADADADDDAEAKAGASGSGAGSGSSKPKILGLVRLWVIDRAKTIKSWSTRRSMLDALTDHLHAELDGIDASGDFNFGWKYTWGKGLTTTQSDALGPLDFPVLLLTERDSAKTLKKLLKQYKIPEKYGKNIDLHELVTDRWDSDYEYGVAAPASAARKQHRKVAFVDVDRTVEDAGADPWYYLGNVILHEMIHCAGLPYHVSDGIMSSTPPTDAKTELLPMGDSIRFPLVGHLKALAKLP